MSINTTYRELLIEQIVKDLLAQGISPSAAKVLEQLNIYVAINDISQPVFRSTNYEVNWGDHASASAWNNANNQIEQDLKVIYRHLLKVADNSMQHFDRWRVEASLLEAKMASLQDRANSLLLLGQDTAGYLNFVQDNFSDAEKIDLENTTATINTDKGYIAMGTNTTGATRINLNGLSNDDIEFSLLTLRNVINTSSADGSQTRYVVSDATTFWQERVATRRPGPVSVEVKITLPETKTISRLDLDLHQANTNSATQVLPLLSTDNYSYKKLNSKSFVKDITDKATFQFVATEAKYIKLVMTKSGYDLVQTNTDQPQYVYEFGIDELALYSEGFSSSVSQQVVSVPLSVEDEEGNLEEFSKLTLEVCEDVPEGTSINYSVAVFNDPTTAFSSLSFVDIDPNNRANTSKPTVLDFGDLDTVEISGVNLSFNNFTASGIFLSPAQDFKYVTDVTGTTVTVASGESSNPRYSFALTNQMILDHTIASGINVARGSLEVWRNVSVLGDSTLVRGIQNGWGFEDPYYKTTVYVENPDGIDIDFGSSPVIIDGVSVTGKTNVSLGVHVVRVHQDNWLEIINDVDNLQELKDEDPLYPYNHRYLVEGFEYPGAWSTTEEKIYEGFDIVAEYLMTEASVFDMNHNVSPDNYRVFARDFDVADSTGSLNGSVTTKPPAVVFLVNINEDQTDFYNEQYLVKFRSVNSLFSRLRLKAILKTTDSNITPFLDNYRIKIST